ncbi:hypothetical protein GGR56DRAFT_675405 [Xylariaceae sp. FL0804]|nr:hypothetical protein GGR56DRAFT_675405 [Xylariaceae sp. FL0804]
MSESSDSSDAKASKRHKMGNVLREGLDWSRDKGLDAFMKSKLQFEHSIGLGHKPNVVPEGDSNFTSEPRLVEIGWHPVGGFAGKWFAEKTGLGKLIAEEVHRYPDPSQHWSVIVGGYVHELWMDEHLDVIYINEELKRDEWHTFEVGKTRFNDEALREAGEMTIYNMREKRPAYNLISNNCQNFAVMMLDAIQVGAHKQFATSFAVYKAAIGAGSIKDLFADHPDDDEEGVDTAQTVQHAQQSRRHHGRMTPQCAVGWYSVE